MKKTIAKILRRLTYIIAQLPLGYHYFWGDVLSWLLRNVVRYRTSLVWMNISRAFPEKKYSELNKIHKAFYRHLGEIFAEAIWFGGCDYKRLQKSGIVRVKNPEVLAQAYNDSPSVTIMCSHCGNWELLGGIFGYLVADGAEMPFDDGAFSVVYKRLSSEVSDHFFASNRVHVLENGTEYSIIESNNILRYSIKNRNEKRIYGYPADQGPYKGMGRHDMGLFLNQKTFAMTGSLGVACKLSHAVLYLKMKHVSRGKYEWEFIPICNNASEYTPDVLMRKYYDLLEMEINETPHNWLWSHNRWNIKTK